MPSTSLARSARKKRIRSRLQGTTARPRLSVTRSLTQMSVQVIDDQTGKTIASASTKHVKGATPNKDSAAKLGSLIAERTKAAGVTTVVFDRNGYKYHGRIQALADAAREGGLTF